MAVTFPQLRVTRRRSEPGETSGLETDLHQTTGEFVFVHQGHMPFNVNDFRRLWEICRTEHYEASAAGVAGVEPGLPALAATTKAISPAAVLLGLDCQLEGIRALRRRAR
jgi:hypothetical protein